MFKETMDFLKAAFIFLLFLILNIYISIFIFVKIDPYYTKRENAALFFAVIIILLLIEYYFFSYKKNATTINFVKTTISKKPKIIFLLIFIFSWGFIKSSWDFFNYQNVAFYITLDKLGQGYLFFVVSILALLFSGCTIWFLCKPRPIGFLIAASTLFLFFLETIIGTLLIIKYPNITKESFVISRQTQGLFVDERIIDKMFSTSNLFIIFLSTAGMVILWGSLLLWKKDYFFKSNQ